MQKNHAEKTTEKFKQEIYQNSQFTKKIKN